MEKEKIFARVDHTLLKADATWPQVRALCEEALRLHMASVCIPPCFVSAARVAFGPELRLCTVIGFPLGYHTKACKVNETLQAVQEGADELDMVINIGDAKSGRFDLVSEEIRAVREAAGDRVLKVIIETCYLTEEEKIALCHCVTESGADYIKTSTGFGPAGATLEDIALFRQHLGPGVRIKAAGGIRTAEQIEAFLRAGCDRIGASRAVEAYAER